MFYFAQIELLCKMLLRKWHCYSLCKLEKVAVPSTVRYDHLILAQDGAQKI